MWHDFDFLEHLACLMLDFNGSCVSTKILDPVNLKKQSLSGYWRIQNPVKHLRLSVLEKQLTVFNR